MRNPTKRPLIQPYAKGHLRSSMPSNKLTVSMVALVALAAGCSNDMDELKQKISEVKSRPGDRIEPLPEIKPYDAFVYNPNGLRSPFVPSVPVQAENAGGLRPDSKRAREFLEQFPLDTMRMVGTLKLQGRLYGLVQGKDGLVHRVLPGGFIGQNEGRIANISDSKISLIEIVPDGLGGYIERPAALALSE
jgi:type IV pilus assembly protein PilP